MGRPDPGPLQYVLNTFSQSDAGQKYWADRDARDAHAAAWPGRKLYERGAGEATDVHPSDLVQGQHADCFLVAAMAALVQQHPDPDRWMKEVIKENADGTYTVTFYEHRPGSPFNPLTGRPESAGYVQVPVTVDMGLYRGARSDDGAEKWPAVIEAAYAKQYAGEGDQPFDKRDQLGEAMERLTGLPTTHHAPQSVSIEQMGRYLQEHHAVKVASKTGLPGLGSPHPAYAPDGLATFPNTTPMAPAVPPYEAEPARNDAVRQWHEYYVHKVDPATGTVTLHNVHDGVREDITMPYGTFQTAFESVRVNPIYTRERPR